MKIPQFVKERIVEGRNYIGGMEAPDYNPADGNLRTWVVTQRRERPGFTGLIVEYHVNGKCRCRMPDIILEEDGTIY